MVKFISTFLFVVCVSILVGLASVAKADEAITRKSILQQSAFEQTFAETAACFREATISALRYGKEDTSQEDIFVFTITVCGGKISALMRRDGFKKDYVQTLLEKMATQALLDLAGRYKPPKPSV